MGVTLAIIEESRKSTGRQIRAYAHEVSGGPASGDIKGLRIPAPIKTLLSALTDDDLDTVVRVYRDAMGATRRFWVDEGKDENGRAKGHWQEEEDHRVRVQAANMVAAYMEGLPIQRQVMIGGKFAELGDMIREMRLSGEAARLLPAVHSLPTTAEATE